MPNLHFFGANKMLIEYTFKLGLNNFIFVSIHILAPAESQGEQRCLTPYNNIVTKL